MRAANVFERPRNKAEPEVGVACDTVEVPGGNEVCDGEAVTELSELYDCDLEVMGIVRPLRLVLASDVPLSEGQAVAILGSSSGIASGAGTGFPLAAATNWFSVQDSE